MKRCLPTLQGISCWWRRTSSVVVVVVAAGEGTFQAAQRAKVIFPRLNHTS
jgi:hypothetical protein